MKKSFFILLLVFLPVFLFSESYKIKNAEYDINGAGFKLLGKTQIYPLNSKYPLDTKTTFKSREAFEKYLKNYKQSLDSSRFFDEVTINYEANPSDTEDLYDVILMIKIQDSHHFIVMPYPRYSSNDGLSLKIKAKDMNFLGSLNTMNMEINLSYSDKKFKPGFAFSFDAPFAIGPIHAVFVNDYSLNYALTEKRNGFEWNTKTGLEFSMPFNKFSINLGLYQYTHSDFSYIDYNDDIYFTEQVNFGIPVRIVKFSNFTDLTYSPSIGFNYHWDFDGINPENDSLSSPEVSFSHSLSNGKVSWNDNFRKGYNLSLSNTISYNIQRKDLVPSVSFEGQFFWNYKANEQDIWNRFGICSNLYVFHYFDLPSNNYKYGASIGSRLRGILDNSFFGNDKPYGTASSGIVLNLDLPHNIFTAYFPKEILNFNLQFSPFFDMALVYNRNKNRYFNFEDGYYCAGLELLVYPLNWSSVTVRASLGFDLSKDFFTKGLKDNKEIFIGIGLQY